MAAWALITGRALPMRGFACQRLRSPRLCINRRKRIPRQIVGTGFFASCGRGAGAQAGRAPGCGRDVSMSRGKPTVR